MAITITKKYDLEDRTFAFANDVRGFIRSIPKDLCNLEDCKQLTRSSGSVGANYIEANASLSKKDFRFRIRICLKEAKESQYWLKLLKVDEADDLSRNSLVQEARELSNILGAIIRNSG